MRIKVRDSLRVAKLELVRQYKEMNLEVLKLNLGNQTQDEFEFMVEFKNGTKEKVIYTR